MKFPDDDESCQEKRRRAMIKLKGGGTKGKKNGQVPSERGPWERW